MALGDPYCSVAEAKLQAQIRDSDDDALMSIVVGAVSRGIDTYCGRQFNDAGSASARLYSAKLPHHLVVDDFHTTSGLVVELDTDGDGVFETTVSASDYTLYPLNGVRAGHTGWPYRVLELHDRTLPTMAERRRPIARVTARWGWASVPGNVKMAALIGSARLFGRKHSHNGLVGQGEFVFRVSRETDPDVVQLLEPYVVKTGVI